MTQTRRSRPATSETAPPERIRLPHRSDNSVDDAADEIEIPHGAQQAYKNADEWWRSCAERAIRYWAESGIEFDSYSLIEIGCPEPDNFRRWGAVMAAAYRRGQIEPVSYRRSRRPGGAPGVCRTWRGVPAAGDRQ